MIFNRYVLAVFLSAVVSSTSLYLVLSRLDPFVDEQVALPLLFISLFFAASSLLTLIGFLIRWAFYGHELFLNHFNVSLRQGIILGFAITGLLGLQVIRTLTWWNGGIIVLIAFLSELYFVAQE